jgi:hypothetical protein
MGRPSLFSAASTCVGFGGAATVALEVPARRKVPRLAVSSAE